MLLCIRGISAEKAAELLDHYATPHAFWDRLRQEHVTAEQQVRDHALAPPPLTTKGKKPKPPTATEIGQSFLQRTIRPPERRRQFGEKLSASIWDVFMQE